jgi:hypothetical protein
LTETPQAEPWLRGTLLDLPAVPRAVVHALDLAGEDLEKWCRGLSDAELQATFGPLPPVAFHIRHLARSLDRLLTYAEGRRLGPEQLAGLKGEKDPGGSREALFGELHQALARSRARVRSLAFKDLEQSRVVGQKALPATLGGLLVHIADHTQRHVGQAITTAKIVAAARSK